MHSKISFVPLLLLLFHYAGHEDLSVIFCIAMTTYICCADLPPACEAVGGVRRFFDISVPRNVAPEVGSLPGTAVFNVDDLREVVEANKEVGLLCYFISQSWVVDKWDAYH